MQEILYLTIFLGAISTTIAYGLCLFFLKSPEKIAGAFSWNLFGEGLMNSIIFIFAVLHAMGKLTYLPPEYKMILRLLAFSVSAFSTIHLSYYICKIIDQNARNTN